MRNPDAKKHYNNQTEKVKMLLRNHREKSGTLFSLKWNLTTSRFLEHADR